MKIFLIFLVALYSSEAFLSKEGLEKKWNIFKNLHGKRFMHPKEELFRKSIFERKVEEIEDHNERFKKGLETYEIGINQFSDYTEDEMLPYTHGLLIPSELPEPFISISPNSTINARASLPSSFDWRSKGMVTPVKNQGNCGSCWAFSTNGALESHCKIHKGVSVTLSEQQLVDCDRKASGCRGGWMTDAYMYIAGNGGINYDRDYPYRANVGTCHYQAAKPRVNIRGYAYLTGPNEEALRHMVVTQGPVSVAVDATGKFASYSGGVYYNPSCATNKFTHAMVIVGYGREKGQDYWLVKNSWGAKWGQKGYIKMARNRNNHCGIASRASYPVF